MKKALPTVSHTYQNHLLDSTRWNAFSPRADDIIIASSMKSGTTWTQWITLKLLFPNRDLRLQDISPWLERRPYPGKDTKQDPIALLEAQKHRRVIKTHLPLDGLPYSPQARYIVLGRDGRDVALSLWNHCEDYSDEFLAYLNSYEGAPFPRSSTFNEFWADWISKGWFEWEHDGYPYWSHLHFIQTWWDFRYLPNILFVHFADLLADLPGNIQGIADHLGISLSESRRSEIAEELTFENMKNAAEKYAPVPKGALKDGPKRFFNKGTNGRWKYILTEQQIVQYELAVARTLSPDCAVWLEHGSTRDSTAQYVSETF
ncbi:hypothetical protein BTA51_21425 [Hahella sp. CCB-MM4]|uniref:sulfotransferase domain-containing protein n=1 Tax=Hahella sp. (strain CCB-MM4) TaxID=1926491 RepID=UPI000B9A3393|nr:sulfotransferase domain-containing protein [Hahella sp. CCB-MM4]OZG71213.1 hypothetical protein BTA51_21425 [Hahella sp. CCB-MM4]